MSAPKTAGRASGYGPGYSYVGGRRALVVCAESLELARHSVCPNLPLWRTRAYPANPRRQVFIFQRT